MFTVGVAKNLLCSALLLAFAADARATSEFSIGVGAANSFEDAANEQGVVYAVLDENGEIIELIDVVPVSYDEEADVTIRDYGTFGDGARANGMVDLSDGVMRPVWIDPSENLVQSVKTRDGFIASSDAANRNLEAPDVQLLGDGDLSTAIVKNVDTNPFDVGVNQSWVKNVIVSLGWDLPVNRVRFYPRPEFAENFLPWFELGVVPSSSIIRDRPTTFLRGTRWFRDIGFSLIAKNDPVVQIVDRDTENLEVVVDRSYPTRHVKFVTLRPINPLRTWEIAEFEIYGEGYVRDSVYRTDILDFGRPVVFSRIRWKGEQPEGTSVELRTRSGNTEQPFLYSRRLRNGQFGAVDRGEYNKIFNTQSVEDPFGGARTNFGIVVTATFTEGYNVVAKQLDAENWSAWSPPYDFAAGLRDETQQASAWRDGTQFVSKSPARYLQFEVSFSPTSNTAPHIEQIEFVFGEAVAEVVVGEISPTITENFDPQTFTYVVRPVLQADHGGFDRLEIVTGAEAQGIRSVKVDDVEVGAEFLREIDSDRLTVGFDRLMGSGDTEKRIEVVFDVPVLRFGHEFTGFVYSSDEPGVRQQVEEGNATLRFGDNTLSVKTPRGVPIVGQPQAVPPVFSPNGDGVNDRVLIQYQIRVLGVGVPHELAVYDLAGRRVRQFTSEPGPAGVYERAWDGTDESGKRVLPGTYIYRIKLETGSGTQLGMGTISVVY